MAGPAAIAGGWRRGVGLWGGGKGIRQGGIPGRWRAAGGRHAWDLAALGQGKASERLLIAGVGRGRHRGA